MTVAMTGGSGRLARRVCEHRPAVGGTCGGERFELPRPRVATCAWPTSRSRPALRNNVYSDGVRQMLGPALEAC
jgi:hypothetical protein